MPFSLFTSASTGIPIMKIDHQKVKTNNQLVTSTETMLIQFKLAQNLEKGGEGKEKEKQNEKLPQVLLLSHDICHKVVQHW